MPGERQLQRHVGGQRGDDQKMQHAAEPPIRQSLPRHRPRRAMRDSPTESRMASRQAFSESRRDRSDGARNDARQVRRQHPRATPRAIRRATETPGRDRAQSRSTACSRECPSSDTWRRTSHRVRYAVAQARHRAPASNNRYEMRLPGLTTSVQRHVVHAHQQTRAEVEEAAAAIRFVAQHACRHAAWRRPR